MNFLCLFIFCLLELVFIAEGAVFKPSTISVAAFNVQRFGRAKMSKPVVVDVLVRILSRYDIALIEEIVDETETAIVELVNNVTASSGLPYKLSLSPRLGRHTYEQYGFIYRSDRVHVLDASVYPDINDVFEREPYIVTFARNDQGSDQFTLAGIHTKPSDAVVEIDALSDVLDYITSVMAASRVLILGDYNADCSYVRPDDWPKIRLRQRDDVDWLIPDDVDTTATDTDCAYDRLVVTRTLDKSVEPASAGVFYYDRLWDIPENLTLEVSDHYPVSLQLEPETVRAAQRREQPYVAPDIDGNVGEVTRYFWLDGGATGSAPRPQRRPGGRRGNRQVQKVWLDGAGVSADALLVGWEGQPGRHLRHRLG